MAQPFSSLPNILRKRQAEMLRMANTAVQTVAVRASDVLTADTPVKRGVARSNWVGSIGSPFEGELPAYSPIPDLTHEAAPPERKFETENLLAARSQNRVAVSGYDVARHSVFFLRNNAAHIGLLNDGHSLQTPEPGFFERGVAAAREVIAGVWKLKG